MMRVLLTGGGTAGHINPALAIAETVKQNAPNAEILFVGTHRGKEGDLIPREGYPLRFVESRGFYRPLFHPKNIGVAWTALRSPYAKETVKILEDFRPDIVIGTGGYACWPIAAAAIRMGIPCALHESNAQPGLAIRRLQKKADRIWLHFPESAERLSVRDNVRVVGNPLRAAFGVYGKAEARKKLGIDPSAFYVLSYGGSIGAQNVDRAMLDLMEQIVSKDENTIHLHSTGTRGIEAFRTAMHKRGLDAHANCIATDYIYNMPMQMAAADLIVCRAGAMTVSELAKMKKAAILIPSPNVTDNHQLLNAKALSDVGAALTVEESELSVIEGKKTYFSSEVLLDHVRCFMKEPQRLLQMEQAIAAFGKQDANQEIWKDMLSLIGQGKRKS